jgi:hypothetical protein
VNIGAAANFQWLLDNANGKYFMWAPDDDNWDSEYIECCVSELEQNRDLVACSTACRLDFLNNKLYINNFDSTTLNEVNKIKKWISFTFQNPNIPILSLFVLDKIQDLKINKMIFGEDQIFILECLKKGDFKALNDRVLFTYRAQTGDSGNFERYKGSFSFKSHWKRRFFVTNYLKYVLLIIIGSNLSKGKFYLICVFLKKFFKNKSLVQEFKNELFYNILDYKITRYVQKQS